MNIKKTFNLLEDVIQLYKSGVSMSQIEKQTNVCSATIANWLKQSDIPIRTRGPYRKYKVNENFFSIIDNEEKAYFLGLMFADGCVWKTKQNMEIGINLNKKDLYIIEKFKKALNCEKPIYYTEKTNSYTLRISSNKLFTDLCKHGCVPRKSLVLTFPTTVPDHLIHHFMRGFFDGDGHVKFFYNKKNLKRRVFAIASTQSFCQSYVNILSEKCNIHKQLVKPMPSIWHIVYEGKYDIEKIFNFLYKDATIFLNRKYDQFILIVGDNHC